LTILLVLVLLIALPGDYVSARLQPAVFCTSVHTSASINHFHFTTSQNHRRNT